MTTTGPQFAASLAGLIDGDPEEEGACPCRHTPGAWCDIHDGDNPVCDCPRQPRAWCQSCEGCAACGQCQGPGHAAAPPASVTFH